MDENARAILHESWLNQRSNSMDLSWPPWPSIPSYLSLGSGFFQLWLWWFGLGVVELSCDFAWSDDTPSRSLHFCPQISQPRKCLFFFSCTCPDKHRFVGCLSIIFGRFCSAQPLAKGEDSPPKTVYIYIHIHIIHIQKLNGFPQENGCFWWFQVLHMRGFLSGNLKSGDSKKSKRRGSYGAADRERRDAWLNFVFLDNWYLL